MIKVEDVVAARESIRDSVYQTPLLQSEQLTKISGNKVFLKSEHLQKTGSFKVRGAINMVKTTVLNGANYLTTASSGNHGQAVAYSARRFGIPSSIVVPENASTCKLNGIAAYGGRIEKCGTTSGERITRAIEIAEEEQGVYIPPYDDPLIMAGQGTIGLEILEQIPEVDTIIVPIGGGGLLSGILIAIKESKPNIKIIGVEPKIANDTYLSFQQKKITAVSGEETIADGLRTNQPGSLTFPVLMKYLDDIVLVDEEEIRQGFTFVLERMKQLIEPSSATVIAATMFGKLPIKSKNVITVISGGNVDIEKIPNYLSVTDF